MMRSELGLLLDLGNGCAFFDGLSFPDHGLFFGVVGDDSMRGSGPGRTVVPGVEVGQSAGFLFEGFSDD